jgi:hypothetical protein
MTISSEHLGHGWVGAQCGFTTEFRNFGCGDFVSMLRLLTIRLNKIADRRKTSKHQKTKSYEEKDSVVTRNLQSDKV